MMNGLFILICLFSFNFSSVLSYATGLDNGLILRFCCVFTFLYSIFVCFKTASINISSKSMNVFWISLFFTTFVLISFFFTKLKYGYDDKVFEGTLLSFGSKCFVAPFFALAWIKRDYLESVIKSIVPYVTFVSFFQYLAVQKLGTSAYMHLEIGYQTLSYTAAFSIGLLLFFIEEYLRTNKVASNGVQKVFFFLSFLLIFLNIYILISGGGKGAFVLTILEFVFVFYSRLKKSGTILFLLLMVTLILIRDNLINMISTLSGGGRILSLFFSSDISEITSGRDNLYADAIQTILNSYCLGGGTGSVIYKIGYYAHNLFLDILIDWGWIGLVPVLFIIGFVIRKFWMWKSDRIIYFTFLLFMMSFVMLIFSGSFYCDFNIWFSTIAILGYEKGMTKDIS